MSHDFRMNKQFGIAEISVFFGKVHILGPKNSIYFWQSHDFLCLDFPTPEDFHDFTGSAADLSCLLIISSAVPCGQTWKWRILRVHF